MKFFGSIGLVFILFISFYFSNAQSDSTYLSLRDAKKIKNKEGITKIELGKEVLKRKTIPSQLKKFINLENLSLKPKMKQRKDAGFNAVATVGAATGDKYNTSLNFNYNLKKVNFFGSYDYRLDNRPAYRNATTKTTPQNDTSTYLLQNSNSTRKVNTNNFKIGMDLFINKKNTITFSWMLKNSFKTSTENFQNIDSVYAYSDNNIISKYRKYFISNNIELNNDNDNDFAVNYKKTFDKKGKEFTADMIYTTDQSFFKQYITTDTSTIFPQTFTQTIMNTSIANMLVNFVNPLSKPDSKYEVGFQGTITNTDDENTYNLTALNYDFNQLNHFIYNLQTYDVYGLYSNTFQRFKYEAGLRLEQTFTSGVEKITGYEFNRQYFDYFPSLNITRKLWNSIDFRLSYTKRISRPNVNFLNPFVDRSNSPMYSSGNPNLNPQYVNSYELGGMKKWKKTTLNADVFYRQIDNVIKRIVTLDSIRNGYSYTDVTFQNLSSGISYGIDVILEQQILKFWKVNANYSYFKTIINGSNIEQGMTTNNYSYTAKLTSNMMLPQKFSFQITGFYNGPMVTPQGTMRPMSSVDAALKKDIWKDKASLSFRVSDIFNTLKFSTTVLGDGFTGTLVRKRETRIAFLSFTYKINGGVKQKAKPQQQDDKINLDDNL